MLPRSMLYTTDTSVTIWILNKNKTERTVELPDVTRNYRNREQEVLFMDLRQIGIPFEKKFIQFSEENIQDIAKTYHQWQQKDSGYEDVTAYYYNAILDA